MLRPSAPKPFRLLFLLALASLSAQALQAKTHVFLFDKSGSMDYEQYRRYDTLRQWLVSPLLKSGAFESGDHVIVRWFAGLSDRRDDDLKMRHEPFDERKVLESVPKTGDSKGKNTDIPQGLEQALSDVSSLGVKDDVLIWIVTDNVQSKGGSSSDSQDMVKFYKMISENRQKMFHAAYLFPLVREGSNNLTGTSKEAMLMYLLHYSAQPRPQLSQETVAGYAQDASTKIGNPVITWFPIGEALVPEPVVGTGEEEEAEIQVVNDALSVGSVREGEQPNFNVQVRFKSRAVQRSISGQIANEKVELNWSDFSFIEARMDDADGGGGSGGDTEAPTPAEPEPVPSQSLFQDAPDAQTSDAADPASKWLVTFDARDKRIQLMPGQKTDIVYNVNISNPAHLFPASRWTTGLAAESEPIIGTVKYQLVDLKSELEQNTKELLKVANGHLITGIAQMGVQESKPFSFQFQFRLQHDRSGRLAAVIALGLLILAALLALVAVLLIRTRYELTTPSGERVLAMPLVGKEYISLNGNRAAVISRVLGTLKIAPIVGYSIDGATAPRRLSERGDQFNVINQEDNRGYPHAFRRLTKQPRAAAVKDDFLD